MSTHKRKFEEEDEEQLFAYELVVELVVINSYNSQ